MSSKARILLTIALVLSAWIAGFVMGGFFRGKNVDGAAGREGSSGSESNRAGAGANRIGVAFPSDSDPGPESERRVPWDRERLKHAAMSLGRDGSIADIFRHSIQLMDQLGPADFPMAMEAGEELAKGNHDDYAEFFSIFAVARWTELNPKAAGEYMVKNEKFGGFIDFNGAIFWSIWAGKDPAAAAAFAKESGNKSNAMRTIIETLARSDADNALAFARIHAPELIADGTLASTFRKGSGFADPERVARRLESLGTFDQATVQAMRECSFDWAKRDRTAAREWALSLREATAREKALLGIYEGWFKADAKAATAAMIAEPRNGRDLTEIAEQAILEWELKDWQSASGWIEKLPSEQEKTSAAVQLSQRLARDDAAVGAEFLKALPAGAIRDAAVAEYTANVSVKDAGSVMAWALSISDSAKKKGATQGVLKRWFEKNPAEAFEWLESGSGMTPEQRQDFLGE